MPHRLDLFARTSALTAREGQVLINVARGGDARVTIRSMNVSAYTVQEHLRSVFAKAGTNSRTRLLSVALGTTELGTTAAGAGHAAAGEADAGLARRDVR